MMDEYTVNCTNCEDEFSASYVDENVWSCDQCGTLYEGESGRVVNITERDEFRKLYLGAKTAGMLNTESEFNGDKEILKW
jgi:hypothetical protein